MVRTDRYKYTYRAGEAGHELFDLVNDPLELRNLAGKPEWESVERASRDRLLDWLVRTNHPMTTRDLQPGVLDEFRTSAAADHGYSAILLARKGARADSPAESGS
jgi:hypothetical protein